MGLRIHQLNYSVVSNMGDYMVSVGCHMHIYIYPFFQASLKKDKLLINITNQL